MENPLSWNEVEIAIHEAVVEADKDFVKGIIGGGYVSYVYTALKEKGYLREGV